jgi:hypothetical protein
MTHFMPGARVEYESIATNGKWFGAVFVRCLSETLYEIDCDGKLRFITAARLKYWGARSLGRVA